jgi:hypothetical protein
MGRLFDTKVIGKRITALHQEFDDLKKLEGLWFANFGNASRDVALTIKRCDSDIHQSLLKRVYQDENWRFEYYEQLSHLDMDEMTPYGLMLAMLRYCVGYGGNLEIGEVLGRRKSLALVFAYEAYWRFGDDFLLGNVVESFLQRLGSQESWKWPEEIEFGGKEEIRQYQWLGREVILEMKKLARYHRIMAPGMENFRTGNEPKPKFRDFRAMATQIKSMARAQRNNKNKHPVQEPSDTV